MPELPEVETTRRGIATVMPGRRLRSLLVHEPRMRWPVPDHLAQTGFDADSGNARGGAGKLRFVIYRSRGQCPFRAI
ncbi:MAG TPA: hypothetical protein DIS96_07100 [Pusillimonas sp.]|nr:hypothetical protein [Pusillimonas sp.]